MPAAAPLYTQHTYKVEAAYGTLPAASGGQILRRVSAPINLAKDTYESNEQRTDFQRADMRHGVRRVTGKISGELSCGSYGEWIAAALKRDWTNINNVTGLTLTTAVSGSGYSITRSAGDWIADKMRVGVLGKFTAGSAPNVGKLFLILNVTTTVLTVVLFNGYTLTPETAIAGYTLVTQGKVNYIPLTSHITRSFSYEKWYADLAKSETYTGLRPTNTSIKIPPTGLATIDIDVIGQDMIPAAAQYFTAATAALTTGLMVSVNGAVRVAGALQGSITGMELVIKSPWNSDPVVGTNVLPETVPDTVTVSGSMTVNFDSVTLRDAFLNETEVEVVFAVCSDGTAAPSAMSFCLPRVKLGSCDKTDEGGKYVSCTINFEALLYGSSGTKYEQTTIWMQDTTL